MIELLVIHIVTLHVAVSVDSRGQLTALLQMQTACELSGWLTTQANCNLQSTLSKFVELWRSAKEEESKAHAPSELYKYRTEKHLSNGGQDHGGDENEFARCSDFDDIVHENTLSDPINVGQELAHTVLLVSPTVDVGIKLASIHHAVYTQLVWTSWLWPDSLNPKHDFPKNDRLSGMLLSGYQTMFLFADCLRGTELDCRLSCSHLVAVRDQLKSLTQPTQITTTATYLPAFQNGKYVVVCSVHAAALFVLHDVSFFSAPHDIYQDSNISETTLVAPVLERLAAHVRNLLEMWPENPILTQVE